MTHDREQPRAPSRPGDSDASDPFQASAQEISRPGGDRGPLIVGDKRRLLVVGISLTLVALATSLFLLSQIGAFPPLIALIALIIVGLAVFCFRYARAAHVLRVDELGIDDRTRAFGGGPMPWDFIDACLLVEADGRSMLGLRLSEAYREGVNFMALAVMDAQRLEFGCDVILPPEVFGQASAAQSRDYLNRFIETPSLRSELAEKPSSAVQSEQG